MADLKAPAFAALETTVRLFHNEQVSCMLTGNAFYIVFFHCYAVVYKTEESFAFSAAYFDARDADLRFNKGQYKIKR